MFTLQTIWDDTLVFIKREQALLVPLALATLGLGNMGSLIAQEFELAQPADAMGAGLLALMLLFMLLILLGHLAIITLTLRSGMSVGEALRHAARCLWRVLVVQLVFGLIIGLLAVPSLYKHVNELHTNTLARAHFSLSELLWLLILIVTAIWVSIRIMPVQALQVDQKIGIIDAIKKAFALTRGHFLQLLGFALLLGVVAGIVQLATKFVLGSLFTIIGRSIGSPLTGKVLEALVQSALATVVGLVSAVFVAKLYRALAGGDSDLKTIFG